MSDWGSGIVPMQSSSPAVNMLSAALNGNSQEVLAMKAVIAIGGSKASSEVTQQDARTLLSVSDAVVEFVPVAQDLKDQYAEDAELHKDLDLLRKSMVRLSVATATGSEHRAEALKALR